jgi:PAS domain S-box-containing protein
MQKGPLPPRGHPPGASERDRDRRPSGAPMAPLAFLERAVAIASAVAERHERRETLHPLLPRAIAVDPATQQVAIDESVIDCFERVQDEVLAYASPESTGRMNRSVDSRSDLYSLGVILYEMLTGSLPFDASDPLEWAHCHVVRVPRPPREVLPGVPQILSDIVMKLLAKVPEDRYQTARGLEHDLACCREEWRASGAMETFPLASRDLSAELKPSQALYGRDREVAQLRAAFASVAEERRLAFALVTGDSGIGKSTVVRELGVIVAEMRGMFLAGKCEAFRAAAPHGPIAAAFASLVDQRLAASERELTSWRERVDRALGPIAWLMIDLVPELELLLGARPPVPDVPAGETQSRLLGAVRQFLTTLATSETPCVLFVDDLQWVDPATLDLLCDLADHPEIGPLLVVGAYRPDEVGDEHPLRESLRRIAMRAEPIEIKIGPLALDPLSEFLADSLRTDAAAVRPLAELVLAKTAGNPFSVHQLLRGLEREGALAFAAGAGWRWDLERIRGAAVADHVADLMSRRLLELPPRTREVLKIAACLGDRFELRVLAQVSRLTLEAAERELAPAERAGLIVPEEAPFLRGSRGDVRSDGVGRRASRWAHDRIRQAVRSLVPADDLRELHLRIGRLLLALDAAGIREDRSFEIADHFVAAAALLRDEDERLQAARLELEAGRRAKREAAFAAARAYLSAAMDLLPHGAWQRHFNLTLVLHRERAECELLCGDPGVAAALFDEAIARVRSPLEKAEIWETRAALHTHAGPPEDAVRAGLEGLRLVGVEFPDSPEDRSARATEELEILRARVAGVDMTKLLDAPRMSDPGHERAAAILMGLNVSTSYLGLADLNILVNCKLVELSLLHGHTAASAWGYIAFGVILAQRYQDYRAAQALAEVAMALAKKLGAHHLEAKLNSMCAAFIDFARAPLDVALEHARRGYEAGLESGDRMFAGLNLRIASLTLLAKGVELDRLAAALDRERRYFEKLYQDLLLRSNELLFRLLASLRGGTEEPGALSGDDFDEGEFVATVVRDRGDFPANLYFFAKLQLGVLFENFAEAVRAADAFARIRAGSQGLLLAADEPFYRGLALAGRATEAMRAQAAADRRRLESARVEVAAWAQRCPETFLHKRLLLEAEEARLDSRAEEGIRLYEEARSGARHGGFLQDEGLANELAGRFYATLGGSSASRLHLDAARAAYARWGADAKVRQLEHREAALLASAVPSARMLSSLAVDLDALAVVRASQAISGEIFLDRLLAKLLRVAIEQAGAEHGCLLLADSRGITVAARASADGEVEIGEAVAGQAANVSEAVVHYVQRKRSEVISTDPVTDARFAPDAYLAAVRPRSVLCLPILRQKDLLGMLYLEHRGVPDVFTRDRLGVLELLAAQAAISLENAKLVADLQTENHERRVAEERFQKFLDHAPTPIWILDEDGRFVKTSQSFLRGFGLADEDVIGKTAFDVFPQEQAAEYQRSTDAVLASGETEVTTLEVPWPNGTVRTGIRYKFPIGTSSGRRLVGGVAIDITGQERGRREAEAARNRLAFLARASGVLAASLDYGTTLHNVTRLAVPEVADGAALYLADDQGGIEGVEVAEGDPRFERESQEWSARYPVLRDSDHPVAKVLATGEPIFVADATALDLPRIAADPAFLEFLERLALASLIFAPMQVPGRRIGVLVWITRSSSGRRYAPEDVVLAQDVAQRAALAIESARVYRAAREANRLKDEFLATLSHELRTPLNSILGWSQVLREDAVDDETMVQAVDAIARNAEQQTRLVSDLLDTSSIITGKLSLELRPTAIAPLVAAAADTVRLAAEAKGIALRIALEDGIPSVRGDPGRLQQILWNLLSNAVKFTPRGGSVEVAVRQAGDDVEIRVRDNGEGFAREFTPHLFERFRQADSSDTRVHGGLGLGLALARHLVELHGGQIEGASEGPGRGATFTVRLPLDRKGRERHTAGEATSPPAEAAPPIADARVPSRRAIKPTSPSRSTRGSSRSR